MQIIKLIRLSKRTKVKMKEIKIQENKYKVIESKYTHGTLT